MAIGHINGGVVARIQALMDEREARVTELEELLADAKTSAQQQMQWEIERFVHAAMSMNQGTVSTKRSTKKQRTGRGSAGTVPAR